MANTTTDPLFSPFNKRNHRGNLNDRRRKTSIIMQLSVNLLSFQAMTNRPSNVKTDDGQLIGGTFKSLASKVVQSFFQIEVSGVCGYCSRLFAAGCWCSDAAFASRRQS
jgi:hypothetical protein